MRKFHKMFKCAGQIFVICVAMDSLESNQEPRFLASHPHEY